MLDSLLQGSCHTYLAMYTLDTSMVALSEGLRYPPLGSRRYEALKDQLIVLLRLLREHDKIFGLVENVSPPIRQFSGASLDRNFLGLHSAESLNSVEVLYPALPILVSGPFPKSAVARCPSARKVGSIGIRGRSRFGKLNMSAISKRLKHLRRKNIQGAARVYPPGIGVR